MTDLNAPITAVTVYTDRALVVRRGSIELDVGEHELRINDLPQFNQESLRANGQGPLGTRILNVDVTTAFHSRPTDVDIRQLQDELEKLQHQKQLLQARQEALKERRHWLKTLGEQSRDFARGLAQGQMKPQDCADFFSFMADQSLKDAEQSLDLDKQVNQLQRDIDARKRELNQKLGNIPNDRLAATIVVAVAVAGLVTIEVSYIVNDASWQPLYDVRVQMDEQDPSHGEVELTYMGLVQQNTGENWDDVELALSTARPSQAAILPELKPWYLNVFTPPSPVTYAARAMPQAPFAASALPRPAAPAGAADWNEDLLLQKEAAKMDISAPVEIVTTTVEQTGAALLFRVGYSIDIPSDNTPHKTVISRDRLPCSFDYVTAPVLEKQAHLRATVTNTTERVLLAGNLNIFLGNEYVGTSRIKMRTPNEEFKLFLGVDDAIKVEREPIERAVEKGNILQNDLRRSTYAYAITVQNYATTRRKIVVSDRLPVSQHERIKVKILQIQPQPIEHSKLEILTWEFVLAPGNKQRIEYRFVIEHPQNLKVVGLPSESH